MNSPSDFIGLLRVAGSELLTDTMERYLCSVAQQLEDRFDKCPHCGTKLKQWEPLCYTEEGGKRESYRRPTTHKWCSGCSSVTFNRLIGYMGLPDKYIA